MAPTLLKLALSLALGSGLPTLGKVVPLASSRGACQGRVDELTCAKLLVLKSSAKLLDGKVSDDAALCERLLQGQNRIDRAEVQVCVQEGARVYATDAKFESEMGHFVEHVVLRRRTLVDGPMMANPSAKSIETQGNLGNFVWSTGAGRLVNPFTTLGVTSNQDANIFATANLINPAASMVNMARHAPRGRQITILALNANQIDAAILALRETCRLYFVYIPETNPIAMRPFSAHSD
mmetsp:Transcript_5397/g.15967  ORF Transcript_5397/g.15967 Transcript_5397/m.15967 type:complete len:237 (-) Transcript_5397:1310-2020(-)